VPVSFFNGALLATEFINIPKAESAGVELQANWEPIDHLDLSFTYSYNYTSIESGCSNVGGVPTGTCIIDAVDPTASAPGAKPVGAPIGGYVYQSVKGNPLPQAPANKVAFNATYTWQFDPGNFSLSGSYIWKDSSYPGVFERAYYETPAWDEVDLRAVWSGDHDRYEIIGFVKNAFNSIGYDAAGAAFGSTLPLGQDPAYDLTPPRTYGVEIHVKF
jgi:iron complex outermembrane recepter protein